MQPLMSLCRSHSPHGLAFAVETFLQARKREVIISFTSSTKRFFRSASSKQRASSEDATGARATPCMQSQVTHAQEENQVSVSGVPNVALLPSSSCDRLSAGAHVMVQLSAQLT